MLNFISVATFVAERAHGKKSRTQSPSLFDASGTEAFTSEHALNEQKCQNGLNWYKFLNNCSHTDPYSHNILAE